MRVRAGQDVQQLRIEGHRVRLLASLRIRGAQRS
jgi:hypothetical protein